MTTFKPMSMSKRFRYTNFIDHCDMIVIQITINIITYQYIKHNNLFNKTDE